MQKCKYHLFLRSLPCNYSVSVTDMRGNEDVFLWRHNSRRRRGDAHRKSWDGPHRTGNNGTASERGRNRAKKRKACPSSYFDVVVQNGGATFGGRHERRKGERD